MLDDAAITALNKQRCRRGQQKATFSGLSSAAVLGCMELLHSSRKQPCFHSVVQEARCSRVACSSAHPCCW